MMRALFYRGRHHLRARLLARPFDQRPRPTVATIADRIRREVPVGSASIVVEPDAWAFDGYLLRALLDMVTDPEQVAPEQLGAMSV